MSSQQFLSGLLVLILAFACKKSEPANFHYNFFPVNQGHYVIYQVKDINIDAVVAVNDTTNYFVKAKIGDTIIDNEGRIARRYERYYGPSSTGPWTLHDIWTTIINGNKAELVEENNRTIKMIFSPTKYQTWDPNAYNTMGTQSCFYSDIYESASLMGLSYDSTVTVNVDQVGPEINFIQHKQKFEKYAANVGMIQKVFVDCEINNEDTLQVIKARKIYMNAVSYGNE